MATGVPSDFWWGTASSATQAEGARAGDTWRAWELENPHLERSGQGNDFATRYEEDFALFARFGLTHHRMTIDWARVEPHPGRRDEAEIDRYRAILEAGRAAGLAIWVCLHHFTLPSWFADLGGFADSRARQEHWLHHVDHVADTFGDLVFGWQPVNEPLAFAGGGWLFGAHPPGTADYTQFAAMLEGTHLAAIEAAARLRGGGPVATIHNLVPHFPADLASAEAVRTVDGLYWDTWIEGYTRGHLAVPGRQPVAIVDPSEVFDLVGFTYYMARTVHSDLTRTPYPTDAPVTERGDAIWSDGLGVVIDRLQERLPGIPLLVAEHGVGTDDDELRCTALSRSLEIIRDRTHRGVDIRGFVHWTGIDNYEWEHGWSVPFGCFTQKRTPKPSAYLLAAHALA